MSKLNSLKEENDKLSRELAETKAKLQTSHNIKTEPKSFEEINQVCNEQHYAYNPTVNHGKSSFKDRT